ncbi:hypothetical protein DLS56_13650, partial [Staphylococcus pseudintermedius]
HRVGETGRADARSEEYDFLRQRPPAAGVERGELMRATRFVILAVLLTAAAPNLSAHHSFAAEFDANKPVTLTGSVTRVEWGNPHIWVYLEVKDDHGVAQPWQCEGGAPNTLTRNGWSKDSLKAGSPITIDGFLAKDGSKTCN